MSAILTILGRATRDPEMQQGKNSGTEYVSLDIAVSQRGQDGKEETIYYQCYFNKFLAERLAKAGVKKGTGLMIYGGAGKCRSEDQCQGLALCTIQPF